jgi:dTDP-4-dehydrorhamnose reductase
MLRLGKEKSMLNIVNDQIGAPTYAGDIAVATMNILKHLESNPLIGNQILNYSGEGKISWFDFATFIFQSANINIDIHPIPSADYPTPAERPSWSVLDLTRIKTIYGIAPKYWKESVKECIYLLS